MTETIVAALIAGGVTLLVCLINNHSQSKRLTDKVNQQQSQFISMLEYKLDELTKKVDTHNHLVERMYRIEGIAKLYEEKMKVANHRISDLEKYTGCNRRKEDYPPHE